LARIEWTEEAVKDLKIIEKRVGRRVTKKLIWLSENFETIISELTSTPWKSWIDCGLQFFDIDCFECN